MVVPLIFLFAFGWPLVTSLVCQHGGNQQNATACNCTGTCFSGATCQIHSGCGAIPTVDNSQHNVHGSLNSCDVTVTYTCDVGYNFTSANATSSVTCSGTSWSDAPDFCQRIICPQPVFTSGSSEAVQHVFGDILQFDCDQFHTDRGGVFSITCLEDGTWSGGPALCQVRITAGLVVGLSVTACCVLLLALLPYDFFTYHKRQVSRRRHAHLHRVGEARATPSPGVSPYLSPKTPGRATSSASRPYSLLLSEDAHLEVCERLRALSPAAHPQEDSSGEEEGEWGEGVDTGVEMTAGAQDKAVVDPAHKPLVFPSDAHMSYIDDDEDDEDD